MKWKKAASGNLEVGGSPVSLRTLKLPNELDEMRRFRVYTARNPVERERRQKRSYEDGDHLNPPAWGRLARTPDKRIGVMVTGAHGQMVRVGARTMPLLFVPFSAVSKRVRQRLLIPLDYEVCYEENLFLVREREERPYYVGSRTGGVFHFPGCSRAHRIGEKNLIIYESREEAFRHGCRPGRYCRP